MSRSGRLIVGVTDLRRRLGERRTVDVDYLLPAQQVVDSRSDDSEPVVGQVIVESIERGVSVLGTVSFAWMGVCRRCLEDVEGRTTVDIDEIFMVSVPENSEIIDFDGEQIDLEPVVRDAVLGGLPLAPLCRDDCTGPDPDRYPAVTADEHEAAERAAAERAADTPVVADPRWAALADLELDEPDG